ncbi:oligosaccharide flippase family protein [Treponema brennaborense]|uniref:Polysaccharide biosynthesis protein n=1 Tax=Treponema brennaborense (strain DSM 12168 / CIP 105900 / DD5/3) TaxID=906968 RepID=F4LK05_TREBD|nr:oligosaccharide flippase family protein [Treponema brennaborense]AEE17467.1 polysaccharide biosynthesis protein [Treponema brennaborense DSM 12168]
MKGKRYLAKNMFFLTIGQFGTKLLSFFLVPLYTSVLTSAEYGTYDLYSATVGLLVPILTLNIADSTMRFMLDKNVSKEAVVSISIRNYIFSIVLFTAFIALNSVFNLFPIFNEYRAFLFLMFATNGLSSLFLNIARGFDKIKDVSVSGVLCSAVMIALNLIFLLPLHLGLKGYYLATITGIAVQIAYLFFSLRIYKFSNFKIKEPALNKRMLRYSCPMMLNSVSWWVNSVSDRYIITWLCGIIENGIYSVAYKIPSILTMFQSIFAQAWTLSAVQDFDKEDVSGFFSDMYNFYNVCMVLLCSGLIILTKPLAHVLFANDFYAAWRYVPFLLLSTVFGALSGYIGGIFAAVKNSTAFAISSFVGAAINIVLNIILIRLVGTVGAAVATLVSYFATWIMRLICTRRIIKLKVNFFRDGAAYAVLLLQTVIVLKMKSSSPILYGTCLILLILILILYRVVIFGVIHFVMEKFKEVKV